MRTATGSALIARGETRVICTASIQEGVPRWLAGSGRGWVTAEYGMLPASTGDRKQRDVTSGRPDGRTVEIQRLIGRSLRGVVDFAALGERTIYLDCDVLEADGGTRCASITGAYVALALACDALRERRRARALAADRLGRRGLVRASSAARRCSTSTTREDSSAEVDANVVMTGEGGLVEVQATAERTPLSRAHLDDAARARRARASRSCAPRRSARSARGRGADAARPRHPQRAQGARVGRAAATATTSLPLPDDVELPPETGATFAENALTKARAAAAATGERGVRRRLGDRVRRARRRARRALGALRRRGRDRRRQPGSCCIERAPTGSALALRLRHRARRSARPARSALRGPLHGDDGRPTPRGDGRLRLRPGLRPRRPRRRPHDGRARRRPRRTRSATAAARPARC